MWSDYLKLALDNLTSRKLRSWLTMMGVFIGIMAVVTLISLGQGLQHYIDRQFEKVGGDRISITPGGGGFPAEHPGAALLPPNWMTPTLTSSKRPAAWRWQLG